MRLAYGPQVLPDVPTAPSARGDVIERGRDALPAGSEQGECSLCLRDRESKRVHEWSVYGVSTCTNALGDFRPFRPVPAGGTEEFSRSYRKAAEGLPCATPGDAFRIGSG